MISVSSSSSKEKPSYEQWIVGADGAGQPLVNYLEKKLAPTTRKQVRRQLDQACCRINGKIIWKASWLLQKGDVIQFSLPAKPRELKSPLILNEDEEILVIDKPAGLSSEAPALAQLLGRKNTSIYLVHRLDKETSGILVLAKTNQAKAFLEKAFRQRVIEKQYIAIVEGVVVQPQGTIDLPLYRCTTIPGQTVWKASAQHGELSALTSWKRLAIGQRHSLLALFPHTGRTHQLRVHLKAIGHPIVGDILYGGIDSAAMGSRRHYLHAQLLTVPPWGAHGKRTFAAALPQDFCTMCKTLGLPPPH